MEISACDHKVDESRLAGGGNAVPSTIVPIGALHTIIRPDWDNSFVGEPFLRSASGLGYGPAMQETPQQIAARLMAPASTSAL